MFIFCEKKWLVKLSASVREDEKRFFDKTVLVNQKFLYEIK